MKYSLFGASLMLVMFSIHLQLEIKSIQNAIDVLSAAEANTSTVGGVASEIVAGEQPIPYSVEELYDDEYISGLIKNDIVPSLGSNDSTLSDDSVPVDDLASRMRRQDSEIRSIGPFISVDEVDYYARVDEELRSLGPKISPDELPTYGTDRGEL